MNDEDPKNEQEKPAPPVTKPKAEQPWYLDPPRLVGVLGFVLAVGTLGERFLVRDAELTQQRLQQLRDVTSTLADIQAEYQEALAKAPANVYALSVAKNTKRQMYLQTADVLLSYKPVKENASAQILAALAAEVMSDGRFDRARAYLLDSLQAPGADDTLKPFLLRTLASLFAVPNTPLTDANAARKYFAEALALLEKRSDEGGRLTWAETLLTQANLEVTYGDSRKGKALAQQAREAMTTLRAVSPGRTQLEQIAAAIERGQQFSQTQDGTLIAPSAEPTPAQAIPVKSTSTPPPSGDAVIEVWAPIPGQVSGVEMRVSVDGKEQGQVSNLKDQRILKVPGLAPGVHHFTFTNLTAYFIDPAKGPAQTVTGFSCGGLFEVSTRAALKANIGTGPNGVICALQ